MISSSCHCQTPHRFYYGKHKGLSRETIAWLNQPIDFSVSGILRWLNEKREKALVDHHRLSQLLSAWWSRWSFVSKNVLNFNVITFKLLLPLPGGILIIRVCCRVRIWLFEIRLELDLAGFRDSKPAGSGFGENLLWSHRIISLMSLIKLMASTVLSAAIKRLYCSVLPLLRHCLPVFNKICATAVNFVFLSSEYIMLPVIKIVKTPLDRSAALFFICN